MTNIIQTTRKSSQPLLLLASLFAFDFLMLIVSVATVSFAGLTVCSFFEMMIGEGTDGFMLRIYIFLISAFLLWVLNQLEKQFNFDELPHQLK